MITNELLERVKNASPLNQAIIIDEAITYIESHTVTREEILLFVDLLKIVDKEVFKQTMYSIANDIPNLHERLIGIEDYLDLVLETIEKLF